MFFTLLAILEPSSPQADAIADLSLVVLAISVVIFLVVIGLVTVATWRFRDPSAKNSSSNKKPNQAMLGNNRVEVLWTLIPFVILIVLFVLTVKTMHAVDPSASDTKADLIVTGHQWWWEVRYPDSGAVTANEIHIPVGQKLLVRLESADVIHDFWVPALARKIDAVPGHTNYLYLEADEPGTYIGACAEFCGTQHAGMHIRVIAQSAEDFAAWEQAQLAIPKPPTSALAKHGAEIFKEKTCYNCHTIAGTGSQQMIGPDLTYVATRETLGSGVLKNSRKNLGRWLAGPEHFKPGSHMPNFQLSDEEVAALVSYLSDLPKDTSK